MSEYERDLRLERFCKLIDADEQSRDFQEVGIEAFLSETIRHKMRRFHSSLWGGVRGVAPKLAERARKILLGEWHVDLQQGLVIGRAEFCIGSHDLAAKQPV